MRSFRLPSCVAALAVVSMACTPRASRAPSTVAGLAVVPPSGVYLEGLGGENAGTLIDGIVASYLEKAGLKTVLHSSDPSDLEVQLAVSPLKLKIDNEGEPTEEVLPVQVTWTIIRQGKEVGTVKGSCLTNGANVGGAPREIAQCAVKTLVQDDRMAELGQDVRQSAGNSGVATSNSEASPAASASSTVPPAVPAGSAKAGADSETQPTDTESPFTWDDHRFEGAFRVGRMNSGEMSPVNWYHTNAQAATTYSIDASWIVHPSYAIGAYFQATPFSFDRKSDGEVIGNGTGAWKSGGFAGKARFRVSDKVLLRVGMTLGLNTTAFSGKTDFGTPISASGSGWNVGAVGDAVFRASRNLGASVQLGFLSQGWGSATVAGPPTESTGSAARDFTFQPIVFIPVGPEFFF